MGKWTKRRDTKRMQFRGSRGRFAKAPSLEGAGLIWVCDGCGQIHLTKDNQAECRSCGRSRETTDDR